MSRSIPGSPPPEAQALGLPGAEGPNRLTWTLWPAVKPPHVAVEEALHLEGAADEEA